MIPFRRQPPFDLRVEPAFQVAQRERLAAEELSRGRILADLHLRLFALKAEYAALRRKYSPSQPRIPAGNSDGGQWTSGGGGGGGLLLGSAHGGEGNFASGLSLFADFAWGSLITEFETGFGRRCVYQFSFGAIAVQGPNIARCQPRVPSSAVTHGYFLNDNWRK